MRLQLLSDLHLERYPDFYPKAASNVDALILAGDIGSYQRGSLLSTDDFGLTRFSPLRSESPWPQVFFVPGNHEFDSLEFSETYSRLRDICERLGIVWLEREVAICGNVRLVGTTLWSDFDAIALKQPNLTLQMQQREKAFRAANYYLRKNTTLHQGHPMLAEGMREMALQCQTWLRTTLNSTFDGTTVVVTHFAPSLRSIDPRYGISPGTAGFCNALDELLPFAQVWMHGHLHCPFDYTVTGLHNHQEFSCRVVANPLGYAHKGEQTSFREDFVVDIKT